MFILKKGLFAPFFVGMIQWFKTKQASNFWLILFVLTSVVITLKLWFAPLQNISHISMLVAPYNNFLIFKYAPLNLLQELPLYISNEPLHYDLYKYSPTCALLFLPLTWVPDAVGLFLWTALNLLAPFFALHRITGLRTSHKNILSLLLLAESVTSALNAQSNGIVLALLLGAIAAFQQQKTGKTVFWILLSATIKIFGLALFVLFLLEFKRIPKAIAFGLFYGVILLALPLFVVSLEYLISEYRWWMVLLQQDGSHYVKLSVMGWFLAWFGLSPPKLLVIILAILIQLSVIVFYWRAENKPSKYAFATELGASMLLWVVLFNHMSESATYVIALGGIVLFFSGEAPKHRWPMVLILLAVWFFTVLGPTDIYPKSVRIYLVEGAQLKAFPVLCAWVYMIYFMIKNCTKRKKPELEARVFA